MKINNNSLKKLLSGQAGLALPMAIVLMVLGGLLIIPVLDLSSTNLKAGLIIEQRTLGAFAAEAGINDAIWKFKNTSQGPFASGNSYVLGTTVNGMTVTINKQKEESSQGGTIFTLKSTATLNGTTYSIIYSQLLYSSSIDLTNIMENAITSTGDVTIKPGVVINGDVALNGSLDNKGTVNGDIVTDPINWPATSSLQAYYWDQVKNLTPLPGGTTITLSGTQGNPTIINAAMANGDLTFGGSGYGRLAGTIYVKGNFETDSCSLDLNNQTIFVEGTIYLKPGSSLSGSGCIIAIGNITFKPNLGATLMLIGVDSGLTPSSSAVKNSFCLSRFTASDSGKMVTFKINCTGSGNVKVGVYADSSGSPGALLNAVNVSQSVVSGWNEITLPPTDLASGTSYWLAAISDQNIIGQKSISSTNKYRSATYSDFSFPNPASSGFTSTTTNQYLLTGYAANYILVMSLEGSSEIYPTGSFYGTIAGQADVYLAPGCTVNWVQPGGNLNIPTSSGGGSGGGGGGSVSVRNYSIQ